MYPVEVNLSFWIGSEDTLWSTGFCMTGFHCDAFTFGTPIKLTVIPKDPSPVAPTLFVLSPLQHPGYPPKTADLLGPDVCLATHFRPREGEMVLNVEGGPVNMSTAGAVMSAKYKSYFFVGFSNQTIHSCELHGSSSNNEADDPCADNYPEKAKMNFYLLLMNGIRVVFTKALAFNTILTIRALLF